MEVYLELHLEGSQVSYLVYLGSTEESRAECLASFLELTGFQEVWCLASMAIEAWMEVYWKEASEMEA